MNSYFVTGGAGFVGCTLIRRLLDAGKKVCVYDNFSFATHKNMPEHDNLTVVEGDIVDHESLKKAVADFEPDHVIHLAALHFIPYCNANPREALRVNVEGTRSVLDAVRAQRATNVILASTAAVYGMNDNANKEEDVLEPYDIYGISKYFTERLARSFSEETKIPSIAARFFNIYGPYETNPHLIPRVMEQFKQGIDVIELGNLTPKRDYIHSDDVSDAVIALSQIEWQGFDFYNIGTGQEYSVTDIVDAMNAITGKLVRIESIERLRRAVEREHLLADNSKLKAATGWEPQHTIKEGLRQTAEYYDIR